MGPQPLCYVYIQAQTCYCTILRDARHVVQLSVWYLVWTGSDSSASLSCWDYKILSFFVVSSFPTPFLLPLRCRELLNSRGMHIFRVLPVLSLLLGASAIICPHPSVVCNAPGGQYCAAVCPSQSLGKPKRNWVDSNSCKDMGPGWVACGIPGGGPRAWECVNAARDLESCEHFSHALR